jgi:hypothetical protein
MGVRTLATAEPRAHNPGCQPREERAKMDEIPGRHIVPFGAVMLILVGAFNLLDGVVAIANPDYFVDHLLFGDITAWGWFFAIFGALQALCGAFVLRGSAVALWPGVALACGNALAQLAFVDSRPAWSVAIIALDVLVIYGFAARGLALGVVTVEEPARGNDRAAIRS